MTPSEIELAARSTYNAVNDTFFTQAEIFRLIQLGEDELIHEGLIVEATYRTTTVVSQQEYSYPTKMVAIKRVEYDGNKVQPISHREWDSVSLQNTLSTDTGQPIYYVQWNRKIILVPIPDDTKTLDILGYKNTDLPTVNSTLEIEEFFHVALVDYVRKEMAAKDGNWPMYDRYNDKFENYWKPKARAWANKRKTTDAFKVVNNEDALAVTVLGAL